MANIDNVQNTINVMREMGDKLYKFDMNLYVYKIDDDMRPSPECGTACCLGGFAIVAEQGYITENEYLVMDRAQSYLGLTEAEATALFSPALDEGWNATLQEGIQMLENLKDTGKVNWGAIFPDAEHNEFYNDQQELMYPR